MILGEIFRSQMGATGGAAKLGMSRFRWSLDKEETLTPNIKISKVLEMLETRPNILSGVEQIVTFILNDIGFTSTDEKSMEYMQRWYELRPKLEVHITNFALLLFATGTSYLQNDYYKKVTGERILDNLYHIPDPSIIYRNLADPNNEEEYWLMEVPIEVREYDGLTPRQRAIQYIQGSVFYNKMIWTIAYPKQKYSQATYGWSRDGYYGGGLLTCAIDNENIVREIIKNWALQAKFRSLGKKIISFYNSSEDAVSLQELEDIKIEFAQLEEEDSLLTNKKFEQADLSFNGQDNEMDNQVNFLIKDSSSSLVPNFMTAFSQDGSMATAAEAKIPFSLRLNKMQAILTKILNQAIIDELRKTEKWLAKDLSFDLGTPELYSRDEMFNVMSQLYNNRAATFNELRRSAGQEPVDGGDLWGAEPPLDKPPPKGFGEKVSIKENKFKEALKCATPQTIKENIVLKVKAIKESFKDKEDDKKKAIKKFLK